MNVGIISQLSNYGGVQSCVISLTKGLNAKGIKPTLLSDRPPNTSIVEENRLYLGYKPIRYSVSHDVAEYLAKALGGALDLIYYFKTSWIEQRYDYVYIFHPNIIVDDGCPHLYYLSMSPRAIGFSGRTHLSTLKFFVYDNYIKNRIPVYEFGSIDRNCVINSQYTEKMFFNTFGRHLQVIYPPTCTDTEDSDSYPDLMERKAIVFFSRIARAKRPDLFIKLARRFPAEQFVLMGGEDKSRYTCSLMRRLKSSAPKNLRILPNVLPEIAKSELKASKIYVFPAINEHFGITTVEAMQNGAIPLVHDSGGQKEIVPWENLRFSDNNLFERLESLLAASDADRQKLQSIFPQHLKQFSEAAYLESMLGFLPETQCTAVPKKDSARGDKYA